MIGALQLQRLGQKAPQQLGAFVEIGPAFRVAQPGRPVGLLRQAPSRPADRRGRPETRRAPDRTESRGCGRSAKTRSSCTMRARMPVTIVSTIEADDEQAEPGDDLRQQRVVHIRVDPVVGPAEAVKRDRRGADPGDDRERLAHEAAREGKDRRQHDDGRRRRYRASSSRHHDPGRAGRRTFFLARSVTDPAVPRRRRRESSTSSLRCPIGTVLSPSPRPPCRARDGSTGTQASAKPSLAASLSRASACATGRTRPDRRDLAEDDDVGRHRDLGRAPRPAPPRPRDRPPARRCAARRRCSGRCRSGRPTGRSARRARP